MATHSGTSPNAPGPEGSAGERGRQLLGATAWVAGPAVWLVMQVIAARQWANPPYDWTTNYVSDLGNTTCGPFTVPGGETMFVCSPAYELMNIGFVVSGIFTALGAVLLWQYWPQGRLTRIAGALWILTGVGRILVGFAPEDVNITLHMIGALVQSSSSVAVLLAAIAIRGTSPALSRIGLALGALGLLGAVLGIGGQLGVSAVHFGFGHGVTERLASHPGQLWLVVVGAAVMFSTIRDLRGRAVATPA